MNCQVTFINIALLIIQIVSKQLHNTKIGKWCVNNVKWQDLILNFQLNNFIIEFSDVICPVQFSLNNICAIKSVISLEMKCSQLSKPEATAARNQNSIGDRTEKKNLGETRLGLGASPPPARWTSSLFQLMQHALLYRSTGKRVRSEIWYKPDRTSEMSDRVRSICY